MISAIRCIELALGSDARLVVVGGAVRDKFLGRDIGDWDLATALMPEEIMARARSFGLKAIPTGLKHGTVTLVVGDRSVEVTTFRSDGVYLDGRHPNGVAFGVSLERDLARRDFTINAMALPVTALESANWADMVIDPYGGLRDLEKKIIRTVGDPLLRFREDGLRVLRACRFTAVLGFDISTDTMAAIYKSLDVVIKTSVERVFVELTKLICASEPERGLEALVLTKLIELWLPELIPLISSRTIWEHTITVVREVPASVHMRWAAILHDCGKCAISAEGVGVLNNFDNYESASVEIAKKVLFRMRASKALTGAVVALICNHNINVNLDWNDSTCRRFLKRITADGLSLDQLALFVSIDQAAKGCDNAELYLADKHQKLLTRLKALAIEHPPLTIRDLAIDSQELMKIARRRGGPWLGLLQQFLLDIVIDNPALNQYEILRDIVKDRLEFSAKSVNSDTANVPISFVDKV